MGSGPSLALTVCPLTGVPFVDPVIAGDGYTYSQHAIEQWIQSGREQGQVFSPLTRKPMDFSKGLVPDVEARTALATAFAGAASSPGAQLSSSARTLSGMITSIYDLNSAFAVLDSLRKLLARVLSKWQPPQLVVIGEESSGKSTLLERLLMMSFFPRAEGVCTRARIHVRLRHTEHSSMPQLEVVDANSGEVVRAKRPVPAENGHLDVSEEMALLVTEEHGERGGVCSDRIIVLHVDGPHLPSIDLVDLPGIVQAPARMAEATRALVDAQIHEHRKYSLFLAVVPAGRRPTSSAAMKVIDDHGLQASTLGVFTHCDELAETKHPQLRRWLEKPEDFGYDDCHYPLTPHGWVGTANPPIEPSKDLVDKHVSHGNLLRLQSQAQNEVQFFQSRGMKDLMDAGLAGTSALQSRLNGMFSEYLLQTWAPLTIFKLNRECERLQYKAAILGSPPADGTLGEPALSKVRQRASEAAQTVLRAEAPGIASDIARTVLGPLQDQVLHLVGNDVTCPAHEFGTRWLGLREPLLRVCMDAAHKAHNAFFGRVRTALQRPLPVPPWPSVEAEAISADPPFVLTRFPPFIEAVMAQLESLLISWRREVVSDMELCVKRVFEVASPYARVRPRLAAEPPLVVVSCAAEEVAGAIVGAFLRTSIPSVCDSLADSLDTVAGKVARWVEPVAEERARLLKERSEINQARSELLRLLGGGDRTPTDLLVLEEISLARSNCECVGVAFAWVKQPAMLLVTLRGHSGEKLKGGLPADHALSVALQAGGQDLMEVCLNDNGDGTHTGSYQIPEEVLQGRQVQELTLSVELHDIPLPGSPFKLLASQEPLWYSALTLGSRATGLQCPAGMAVDSEHIYVADVDNHCVQIYWKKGNAQAGGFVRTFKIGGHGDDDLRGPWGLALARNSLYIVESRANRIRVLSKDDGSLLQKFGSADDTAEGSGAPRLLEPHGLVVDGDRIYVADCGSHCIHVFRWDDTGRIVHSGTYGSEGSDNGEMKNPCGLALDGGYLLVADKGNHRVQVFHCSTGSFVRAFGLRGTGEGKLWLPTDVAVGASFVYVCDSGNNRVQVFDRIDGSFVGTIGSKGHGEGELREPGCLLVDGDCLYVSERGNQRVQAFCYGDRYS